MTPTTDQLPEADQKEFDKRFTRTSKNPEEKGQYKRRWFVRETTAEELLVWLSLKRKEWMTEAYAKGYKEGSGNIAADVLVLHDQYEKGYAKGREEARREERERIKKIIKENMAWRDYPCNVIQRNILESIDALSLPKRVYEKTM